MSMRRPKGQVAVGFVVLMGLVLLLTQPLMNLGEVARLKTATANAADAGALAGASQIASGTNYLARIARSMMVNYWVVQTIALVPFCVQVAWYIELLVLDLYLKNGVFLKRIADHAMENLWSDGKNSTLFLAIGNAPIDDTSGQVAARINAWQQQAETQVVDTTVPWRLDWDRKGVVDEPSWIQFDISYPPDSRRPELRMDNGNIGFWWWVPFPCIFFVCPPPAWGWNRWGWWQPFTMGPNVNAWMEQQGAGPQGAAWAGALYNAWRNRPGFGGCLYLSWFPLPHPINFAGMPVRPTTITNSRGTVGITITRYRESGAALRSWNMKYPTIVSTGEAEYRGSYVTNNPFAVGDKAVVDLVSVQ